MGAEGYFIKLFCSSLPDHSGYPGVVAAVLHLHGDGRVSPGQLQVRLLRAHGRAPGRAAGGPLVQGPLSL